MTEFVEGRGRRRPGKGGGGAGGLGGEHGRKCGGDVLMGMRGEARSEAWKKSESLKCSDLSVKITFFCKYSKSTLAGRKKT